MAGPTLAIREACPLATVDNDGLMSKELVQEIVGGGGGSKALMYTISQPADGSDFIVAIPLAAIQPDGDYVVSMTIMSVVPPTSYTIPFADQDTDQFRVVTDAVLDDGTILGFTITHI